MALSRVSPVDEVTIESNDSMTVAAQPGFRARLRAARDLGNSAVTWPFALPILAVFVFLYLWPLARTLYFSFTDYSGWSTDVNFVGLANYVRVFGDPAMLQGLAFTLLFAFATTVLITCLAIPLALLLNRAFIGRTFVRSMFFFPAVPSAAILGLVWGFILNPLGSGALNSLIGLFGGSPIPWLSDATLARVSLIAVAVWAQTGWHALLYLAYLQAIDSSYYEAAKIDGASNLQVFRSITLPLLAPAMSVSTLLLMTGGLRVFDMPFTLTGGGPGFATRTITQSIIQAGIARGDFGAASALSVMFLIAVGLLVFLQLRVARHLEDRIT